MNVLENGGIAGVPERIRTSDLQFRKPLIRVRSLRALPEAVVTRSDLFRFDSSNPRFKGASCTLGKGLLCD